MELLLSCQDLSKSFGTRTLFENLSMSIFSKDRIGLIGPNGSGKSTFLKILAGLEKQNQGTISTKKDLKIGYVPQTCEFESISPHEVLLQSIDIDLPDYEKERLAKMWESKIGLKNSTIRADLLSGGWKKRLKIASVLITDPDLIFLDEPTNHLDLEGILWLEKFLSRDAPTYLLVSHDRYFLKNTVSRVIEIDHAYPKGMFSIDGPYEEFLLRKTEFLEGQLSLERSFATKARRETEWLRSNAKARTTKSQSRINEAHEILKEHSQIRLRNTQKKAKIDFAASERETRKLLSANNISKSIGDKLLFDHLDFTLNPGTRLGLMGANGSGKTTLLKLLANELKPDVGTIKTADSLQIVYFDQHRAKLPLDLTLRDALSPKGDYVTFRGQPVHVNGWCKRFLFSPDILDLKIGNLSGGERARISIAHLMLQPADLLLLDEPTNDLDIPTLETLEESLLDFPGAVVLISHDRCMLDRICNSFLGLGHIEIREVFADFYQWEKAILNLSSKPKETKEPLKEAPKKSTLSYLEKKEYEALEKKIEVLELEVKKLNAELEKKEIAENPEKLRDVCAQIGVYETQIEALFLRWHELDQKQNGKTFLT